MTEFEKGSLMPAYRPMQPGEAERLGKSANEGTVAEPESILFHLIDDSAREMMLREIRRVQGDVPDERGLALQRSLVDSWSNERILAFFDDEKAAEQALREDSCLLRALFERLSESGAVM